jgi:hypothetical protein
LNRGRKRWKEKSRKEKDVTEQEREGRNRAREKWTEQSKKEKEGIHVEQERNGRYRALKRRKE